MIVKTKKLDVHIHALEEDVEYVIFLKYSWIRVPGKP